MESSSIIFSSYYKSITGRDAFQPPSRGDTDYLEIVGSVLGGVGAGALAGTMVAGPVGTVIGGIAGQATGAILGKWITSDIGLKENLEYIEKSPSGINIYEWNYIGDDQRYRGVIAQDLLAQGKYDAVSEADNGYLAVDYSQLDVQMTPV